MGNAASIIRTLKKRGVTKYRIAKDVGVTWQTIHMWSRDVFKPSREHQMKLELMDKITQESC